MDKDNFVMATALQLSGGTKPNKWQLNFGLKLLAQHIKQRQLLGLQVEALLNELREAQQELGK
ncbi:hypothetical protein [Pseudoalteromonas sp. BDTF-M6]|uniref:hypothetical protein n=1 Tax=Pseudoalteromonas sp. BDTF-M6 TaxID=2796132 RepID=UPI001BAFD5E9|nr:hypothetical protein [Pseudoalteromonas sp. BDTF-M6]MBS3796698.1 hypothetical protein [Pseudoalteromonas sp. BDTF-M6]